MVLEGSSKIIQHKSTYSDDDIAEVSCCKKYIKYISLDEEISSSLEKFYEKLGQ